MRPNSKEYKELQKTWYDKLKDDGFEDIEQEDGNLKTWHSSWLQSKYPIEAFKAKEAYYRMATNFLNDYAFESPLQKDIWALYCEGVSAKDILAQLRSSGYKTCLNTIYKHTRELSKVMLEKKYTPNDGE